MNTTTEDVRFSARKRFNPRTLSEHLTRDENGVVCVDRTNLIQRKDGERMSEDERLFFVTLHHDYRWSFTDFENTTIYFEVDGEKVFGGVYDLFSKTKKTRKLVATPKPEGICRHYSYEEEVFEEICNRIAQADYTAE